MKEKAIAVGKSLCDTMMRKYDAPELPPKQTFLYHQGVFLSGMLNVYKICNEEKYFEYAKKWVDSIIDKDGNILEYDYNNTEVILNPVSFCTDFMKKQVMKDIKLH